ncbi:MULTISPECIES: hypothetical protein [unclassified Mesorhizobium]|nr:MULTISPECIES: hypothetical protein [unclassified Mesorhizobium]
MLQGLLTESVFRIIVANLAINVAIQLVIEGVARGIAWMKHRK